MPARNWLAVLSAAQLLADRGERAVEMVLDRQHVARELRRGIARRLLQLSASRRRRTFCVSAAA